MPNCGRCGGPINAENVRVQRTPTGTIWQVCTWCEFCDCLTYTRVRYETPSLFPKVITDRPTISRFHRSNPFSHVAQPPPAVKSPGHPHPGAGEPQPTGRPHEG